MPTNTRPRRSTAQKTQSCNHQRTKLHREKKRFKMICCRCVLPFLALYMLLEEISAAVLPIRNKREVSWLDQEFFPHLLVRSDQRDLSVGDAGEPGRDVDGRHARPENFLIPTEHVSVQHHNHNHNHRKASEKRRKVAPLDSIGGFQMSSLRNRKDEPDTHREDYRE